MAGDKTNQGGEHPDMDYSAHEGTYKGFMHFAEVGAVACLAIVVVLAVGGVRHAWGTAIFGTVFTIIATAIGIAFPKIGWRAPAVPLFVMLGALIFISGGAAH